jgi:hypothetical protein
MQFLGKPRQSIIPLIVAMLLAAALPAAADDSREGAPATPDGAVATAPAPDASPAPSGGDPAEALLRSIHPDYLTYVRAVRSLDRPGAERPSVYMVLVRPGASDPTRHESAPFAGPGARNDILYDPDVLNGSRSVGWTLLLLDHEYFHARHLAGATELPLPLRSGAGVERHFFEAAAWGYTVTQARSGRYAGLREDEFREALDRYGEHYRSLRALTQDAAPALWSTLSDPLRGDVVVRTSGSAPPAAPWRPSAPDRAPAIP